MGKRQVNAVILAAGKGTRMKSDKAKVLHEVAGRPMILYVVEAARKTVGDDIIVVVGNQAQKVREIISETADLQFVYQEQQLGTAHAVYLDFFGDVRDRICRDLVGRA